MIIDEMISFISGTDSELLDTLKVDNNVTSKSMIFEILDWMKLEYKRTEWLKQGKRDMRKPLQLSEYPWCVLLRKIVQENNEMQHLFQIDGNQFYFSDTLSSKEIEIYLNKVNLLYSPDVFR